MAHKRCPSCGACGLRITPILTRDVDHALLRCASCRRCWRIQRKEFLAACIARIAAVAGEKCERLDPPEMKVLLTCAQCGEPLHFDGFSFSGVAALFVCATHGMFSLSNDRGLVPELEEA
jgi:hypothetical protein